MGNLRYEVFKKVLDIGLARNGGLKVIDGITHFCGDLENEADFKMSCLIGQACPSFIVDVEDEIYSEEERTCTNCRFRRWTNTGFSCYKRFPV